MKSEILIIFDYEIDYAHNLVNVLNRKKVLPFIIETFTNIELLKEYLNNNKVQLLLISSDVDLGLINRKNVSSIYLLSEGKYINEGNELPAIYKFQSVDNIIDEILYYYVDSKVLLQKNNSFLISKKTKAIGVYSPLGNCGKTIFSLGLGQSLSTQNLVLYINLEDFSAINEILGENFSKGMSELIYFLKEKRANLGLKMKNLISNINKLDYISPSYCSLDLHELNMDDWNYLLKEISENTTYDYIIFDIGFISKDMLDLMNQCEIIFMPTKPDFISQRKIKDFTRLLKMQEYNELVNKIISINIPHDVRLENTYNAVELTKGTLGEYIREAAIQYVV